MSISIIALIINSLVINCGYNNWKHGENSQFFDSCDMQLPSKYDLGNRMYIFTKIFMK